MAVASRSNLFLPTACLPGALFCPALCGAEQVAPNMHAPAAAVVQEALAAAQALPLEHLMRAAADLRDAGHRHITFSPKVLPGVGAMGGPQLWFNSWLPLARRIRKYRAPAACPPTGLHPAHPPVPGQVGVGCGMACGDAARGSKVEIDNRLPDF